MTASILTVDSALTFNTVNAHLAQLRSAVSQQVAADVVLDLQGVSACDSAGLAMLIEMKRWCFKQQKTLQLIGIPSLVVVLAQFCGVEDLLH